MAKLKIAGAWSGVLEVELQQWTVPMLRAEVARRSGCDGAQSINLISSGKVLKDGDGTETLAQLGFKTNAKILASRASPDKGMSLKNELIAEGERDARLERLKAAATSLAKRHSDGTLPVEDFNLELENQSGDKIQLESGTDQRALMMGLMFHGNAKQLIRRHRYKDALEVLTMGEEAFSLCNPKVTEMIDNVPILQIDMVWCYFMLRDISWLSVAGIRVSKAREGLERAHGRDASRVRMLQGGFSPELALHLRLELLEGVVAYYNGQFEKAKEYLMSAQAKYFKLQVPDEALSLLMSMGYTEHDAKRALRMNNQDIESAVDFLVAEKAKRGQKRKENLQRQKEIMEQKKYGMTPLKKAVDLQGLEGLTSIGFEKELAAEALRRNENDIQKALDDLTDPETNNSMQLDVESKKRKRQQRQTEKAVIEELVSMGFPEAEAAAAIRKLGTREKALRHLLGESSTELASADGNASPSVSIPRTDAVDGSSAGPSEIQEASSTELLGEVQDEEFPRDAEMEDELMQELERGDALSDYDIEVTKEGEAITEYLALISSRENN